MRRVSRWVALTSMAGLLLSAAVGAQPSISREVLQRADLAAPGREAVMAKAEFPAAGATTGRHTHPGEEIGYLVSGTIRLEIEGEAPRTLKAGDAFLIPAGRVHNAVSTGAGVATAVVTYVVEKGKPLTTPAP